MAARELVCPAEEPESEADSPEAFAVSDEDILELVRVVATERDPVNSRHYTTASPERIKDGCDVALQLLASHLELFRRQGRRAKTGRRKHAAAIRVTLANTNETTLVLAESWVFCAYGLLPPSQPLQDG